MLRVTCQTLPPPQAFRFFLSAKGQVAREERECRVQWEGEKPLLPMMPCAPTHKLISIARAIGDEAVSDLLVHLRFRLDLLTPQVVQAQCVTSSIKGGMVSNYL